MPEPPAATKRLVAAATGHNAAGCLPVCSTQAAVDAAKEEVEEAEDEGEEEEEEEYEEQGEEANAYYEEEEEEACAYYEEEEEEGCAFYEEEGGWEMEGGDAGGGEDEDCVGQLFEALCACCQDE